MGATTSRSVLGDADHSRSSGRLFDPKSGALRANQVVVMRSDLISEMVYGGDPLQDIAEMSRVVFVMKGGRVIRNDAK